MKEEELFKKNFPEFVTEKGMCLSPFWDLFSAGIECATEELNKGCIQTLTKENAELKALIKSEHEIEARKNNNLISRITTAKEIIKDLLGCLYAVEYDRVSDLEQAEQFIKDSEVEK